MTHVGINIKQLRKLHNLNQTEFAKKIGVSQSSLSDLEAGNIKPAIETVISICTAFGCSYEWLLTGNEYSIDGGLNSTLTELVQTASRLNFNDQLELLELAKIKLRIHETYKNTL